MKKRRRQRISASCEKLNKVLGHAKGFPSLRKESCQRDSITPRENHRQSRCSRHTHIIVLQLLQTNYYVVL